jgi:hypothetical protein
MSGAAQFQEAGPGNVFIGQKTHHRPVTA